jgi:hypothetical protein
MDGVGAYGFLFDLICALLKYLERGGRFVLMVWRWES